MIPKKLSDFLNAHEDEINDEQWYDLFEETWTIFGNDYNNIVINMLCEISDPTTIHRASILAYLKFRIDFELDSNAFSDLANSWSRLNWLLASYPIQHDIHKNDIIKDLAHNAEWVGIKYIKPLKLEYSWDDDQDYDLGWFRPEYYEE